MSDDSTLAESDAPTPAAAAPAKRRDRRSASRTRWAGHYWTLRPFLQNIARPIEPPASEPFRAAIEDPAMGVVYATGALHEQERDCDELLLVLHGLGGSTDSSYTKLAALAAHRAGMDSLRLAMRGADQRGDDLYHAALTADLSAALASPKLAKYTRIHLLGYSLGGHLVLQWARNPSDPRVVNVAAVCPPLDLAAGVALIDRPRATVYRRHLFAGLKASYRSIVERDRPAPLPWNEVARIRTLYEWDERVVAPRFGFGGAEDYWAKTSMGPKLDELARPTLLITAKDDPMVPYSTVVPWLERAQTPMLHAVHAGRAGHVGFPADVDFGLGEPGSAEDQIVAWLRRSG